jgi:hypothetical protein
MRWQHLTQLTWKALLLSIALLFGLHSPFVFAEEINYLKHPNRIEWQSGGFYEGMFEDGTPFQMNLPYPSLISIRVHWVPASVTASYWYPRRFKGDTISFKIKWISDNSFSITVQNLVKKGNTVTEETFDGVTSPDKTDVHGHWKLVKKQKNMSFSMKRLFVYKGIDVSLPCDEGIDVEPPCTFVFSASFPVIDNPKVDKWITDLVSECGQDVECRNSLEVAWFSKDLLSFRGWNWGFSHQMAHGYGYSTYRHYDTAGTAPRPVKFDNFIKTSDSCLKKISNSIISTLKKQKYSGAEDGEISDADNVKFLPTPSGIQFNFDPYDVGTYLEGAPNVFIERRKLGNCIKYLPRFD